MNYTTQQPSWFRRNWIWLFGLVGGGMLLAFLVALPALYNSDATRLALQRAQSNPIVMQRLGAPIDAGWFVKGNLEIHSSGGTADLEIPVSGPKGSGTLYASATKSGDNWRLLTLQFSAIGDARREDLLH